MTTIYRGKRTEDGTTVTYQLIHDPKSKEKPLRHVNYHSPSGFITKTAPLCYQFHQDFKSDVIAGLNHDSWELTQTDVHEWLMSQLAKHEYEQARQALGF